MRRTYSGTALVSDTGGIAYNTLTGNSVGYFGGGAYGCTLNNCTLTGNSATVNGLNFGSGGGAASCTLYKGTVAEKVIRYYQGYDGLSMSDPATNCSALHGFFEAAPP